MKLEFGNINTTMVIDDHGSTIETDETLANNLQKGPIKKTYNIRTRVHSQTEEHAEYVRFSDDIKRDRTMLLPSFALEHNKIGDDNGYYYVVKTYTILEY